MIVKPPEWKTHRTLFALDSFRAYWLENERLIRQAAKAEEIRSGPNWAPQTEDEHGEFREEQRIARVLHDEIMTPNFRHSILVMLFVIVERELLRLVRNLEEGHAMTDLFVNRRGSLFMPVADHCKTYFKLDFRKCSICYEALCDLQKVRDCIVHCHAEVSLSRDADYLYKLKDRRPGFYAFREDRIEIHSSCIKQFLIESWEFFVWVFDQLKWQVDHSRYSYSTDAR